MTGSHNSRRISLPTPGQRPRTPAWRRRRSRGLPRDYPAECISTVTLSRLPGETNSSQHSSAAKNLNLATVTSACTKPVGAPGATRNHWTLRRWLPLEVGRCNGKQERNGAFSSTSPLSRSLTFPCKDNTSTRPFSQCESPLQNSLTS